eukprot:COSAG01_NODE_7181_length_3317_cov_1.677129_3_plen_47_part_00
MLAWVSQLLGFSFGGLLAAGLDALLAVLEVGGWVTDFMQRFARAAS